MGEAVLRVYDLVCRRPGADGPATDLPAPALEPLHAGERGVPESAVRDADAAEGAASAVRTGAPERLDADVGPADDDAAAGSAPPPW